MKIYINIFRRFSVLDWWNLSKFSKKIWCFTNVRRYQYTIHNMSDRHCTNLSRRCEFVYPIQNDANVVNGL